MKLTGAAAATALVAGCSSDDGDSDDDDDSGNDNSAEAWEGVSEFSLLGKTGGWEGVEPEAIAGVQNPTLYLTAGEEYEVSWENDDGSTHNFTIESGEGEDLEQTDDVDEQGESTSMSFDASEEMAEYYCVPHPDAMRGEIDIQEGNGGENGEENGNESDSGNGNESGNESE
ncbi:cupredoxin domain-containing protein [Natronorubrum halophilum]|uniref:cupredoxin domain-containing protein n=1 Tax=Natronorubrum halophilum TaxID=1702106 RepID=UPI001EE924EF|nr:plastocyanin/azurin family copper-binding protein [Natronorubrum halophilum]